MKVGSLVYATDQGLGVLAKSFFDAGILTDVLIIRHANYPTHREWYPSATEINIRPFNTQKAMEFCKDMDVMLFFETPFDWSLIPYCRSVGVKTFMMPMYECMPKVLPYIPDRYICPSLLDLQYYPDRSEFIPVPVDNITWRLREHAKVFVHNAGHGGLRNRNGTGELLDAMKYIRAPIRLILRSQKRLQWSVDDPRIELRVGTVSRSELYAEGDVFIFPEKFNGLSLPLQEAMASGMLVMAGNRFPINTWIPNHWLIPIKEYQKASVSGRCNMFDEAVYDPRSIAATVDEIYNQDIRSISEYGREW